MVNFWQLSQPSNKTQLQLKKDIDGTWSANSPENLDGFHYHYKVSGTNLDATTAFDAQEPLNDPYAIALASASGPSIVKFVKPAPRPHFASKKKEDLQIVEVHLRISSRRHQSNLAGLNAEALLDLQSGFGLETPIFTT